MPLWRWQKASRLGGSHLHRDSTGAVPSGTAPFFASGPARRPLVALVLDQLLEAVDDREVAVRVDMPDVARVQPPVGVDRLGGRLRIAEVAAHDLRAAEADLAILPGVELRTGDHVHDLRDCVRRERADRAR